MVLILFIPVRSYHSYSGIYHKINAQYRGITAIPVLPLFPFPCSAALCREQISAERYSLSLWSTAGALREFSSSAIYRLTVHYIVYEVNSFNAVAVPSIRVTIGSGVNC